MSDQVEVVRLPQCDFCDDEAEYDFKTRMGPWANGCKTHFRQHSVGERLGTGFGQRLVLKRDCT